MMMKFEWDRRKAARSRAKHGISFEEAATVFGDPLGRIMDDPRHSEAEQRYVLLGHSRAERLVTVMFTERGEAIRITSARLAPRQERRDYEKGKSQDDRATRKAATWLFSTQMLPQSFEMRAT